jgi:PAS domain S-box-containing protein
MNEIPSPVLAATAVQLDFERQLREMNEALLVSSIRQNELLKEAREGERRFRAMIDALPAAVYTTDASGCITHYNPACVELSGRKPELGSDHWCVTWKLYYPDGTPMPHDKCPMAIALTERRIVRGAEAIAERPDGTRIWFTPYPTVLFDDAGEILGAINMLVDITERKRAEEILRDSQAQLEAELADSKLLQAISAEFTQEDNVQALYDKVMDAAAAVMRSDYASMQMLYPERGDGGELRLLAYRGFTPEAARFWEWVRTDSKCTCGVALRTGQRCVAPDVKKCTFMAGTDDQVSYLQAGILAVQSTPLISRSGALVGMISTHWSQPHEPSERDLRLLDILARQAADLIERNKAKEKVLQQAAELLDLHRRKDEFLAMLSHELRNPLAPIANAVQLLRLEKDPSPIHEQARTIIERQVGQLTRLIEDLMEVSRMSTGRIHLSEERLDLCGVVGRAVETVRPLIAQRRHALTVSSAESPIWLMGDAGRLEQVIVNLLSNAAKYTDEAGHIWLGLEQVGGEAVLRVRDTGVGIAAELLPRIFELFTQGERSLDRAQGGLGIGLALVRQIVQLHHGRVEASSVVGQGSEFIVRLPVVAAPASSDQATLAGPGESASGRCRVLVVDDNMDCLYSMKTLLARVGHEVATALDGPSALEAARTFAPQVVLLDIGIPKLDGYEVARRIRSEITLDGVLLVATTGYGQEVDRQHSRDAGIDHHLVKPLDFRKVQELLASAGSGVKRAD